MKSSYYERLIKTIINLSESKIWERAVLEWEVYDCEEDPYLCSTCVCGKENLRYLFTIRNRYNGNFLDPIGSSCINRFDRSDMDDKVSITEGLFELLHAIEAKKYINLSTEFFSRRLLTYLYDSDAFSPSQYNDFNPRSDYDFLLKMFNKRDKDSISPRQQAKIRAIIVNSLKPFLEELLKNKIK